MILSNIVYDATEQMLWHKASSINTMQIKQILCSKVKDEKSYDDMKRLLRNALFNDESYSIELYESFVKELPHFDRNKDVKELSETFDDDFMIPLELMAVKLHKMIGSRCRSIYLGKKLTIKNAFDYVSNCVKDKNNENIITNIANGNFGEEECQFFADFCLHMHKLTIVKEYFRPLVCKKIACSFDNNDFEHIEDSVYAYLYDLCKDKNMSYEEFVKYVTSDENTIDEEEIVKYHLYTNLCDSLSNTRLRDMYQRFDEDNDNRHKFRELLSYTGLDLKTLEDKVNSYCNQVKTRLDGMGLDKIDDKCIQSLSDESDDERLTETYYNVVKLEEGLTTFDVLSYMDNFYDLLNNLRENSKDMSRGI